MTRVLPEPAPASTRQGPCRWCTACIWALLRLAGAEFLAASADPTRHVMLEALPPEYFYGGIGWFDRPGHVPHATLWPAEDFFNADKTFRHADELQRVATHLGITPAQQVLSYCGGGGAAAVPFFALRFLLGHEDVRLFVESQRGWLQDPRELPVWHYAEPQRLRDAPWLATWAGAMLRGFGLSKVTVVDLRPREAFATGHVPQALNLPLAELHALRHEPEALASMLGRAGLDSSHEAVVLSARGGLDGDAALGALLLERAGQRRVSVYAGTLDSWVDGGRELARPASPPATVRASAYAAYAPRTRPLLVRVAPEATALPSVWISATEAAPAGLAPDGSAWLHLPVPALLTATSRPRPASEIWAELDRRHARVMLRGDDEAALAEAARLRVVLAMMGWRELLVEGSLVGAGTSPAPRWQAASKGRAAPARPPGPGLRRRGLHLGHLRVEGAAGARRSVNMLCEPPSYTASHLCGLPTWLVHLQAVFGAAVVAGDADDVVGGRSRAAWAPSRPAGCAAARARHRTAARDHDGSAHARVGQVDLAGLRHRAPATSRLVLAP
jgi:thiosulfate/3-mercaptopyruvate sulfurtransferase